MLPIISVVLGSYNRKTFLKYTIESIRKNGISIPYEIIVIDGGSSDGSIHYLINQKDIITIVQHNFGTWNGRAIEKKSWGYFINIAFRATHGKYILMLSDDTLLIPRSIMNGYREFEERLAQGEKIGAMAFYFRNYPGDKRYFVSKTLSDRLYVNHGLYLKKALEDVGFIDEENYFFYHADADLCLRLWERGYSVLDCRRAFVEHFKHANVRERKTLLDKKRHEQGWQYFIKRWASLYKGEKPDEVVRRQYIDFYDESDTAHYIRRTKDYWKYLLYLKLLKLKKRLSGRMP